MNDSGNYPSRFGMLLSILVLAADKDVFRGVTKAAKTASQPFQFLSLLNLHDIFADEIHQDHSQQLVLWCHSGCL